MNRAIAWIGMSLILVALVGFVTWSFVFHGIKVGMFVLFAAIFVIGGMLIGLVTA